MTLNFTISFLPFFVFLLRPLADWLESIYRRLLHPPPSALVRGTLNDFTYTKAQLIAENALLRHQLGILHRQLRKPTLNRRDRFWLLLLTSRLATWRDALLIIQPQTLLRWHRAGFRLFWRWNSKAKPIDLRLAPETIALIQQIASENRTWGAERIRGESTETGNSGGEAHDSAVYPRGAPPALAEPKLANVSQESRTRNVGV